MREHGIVGREVKGRVGVDIDVDVGWHERVVNPATSSLSAICLPCPTIALYDKAQ